MAQTAASNSTAATPQFELLEEKIRRAATLLSQARRAREEVEREVHRLRAELAGRARLVAEVERERSDMRRRVERLIKQIDSLSSGEEG